MRMRLPVPPALVRPVIIAVAEWHHVSAETIAATYSEGEQAWLREIDSDLAEMVEALFDWSAPVLIGAPLEDDVWLTADRQILSCAVLHVMVDSLRSLHEACEGYSTGANDVPALERHHRRIGDLLGLFRQTELLTATPVRGGASCRSR